MGQFGFFDADKRLAVISAKGDPLEMIDRVVPFESFRASSPSNETASSDVNPAYPEASQSSCRPKACRSSNGSISKRQNHCDEPLALLVRSRVDERAADLHHEFIPAMHGGKSLSDGGSTADDFQHRTYCSRDHQKHLPR
jgi:hypothetical protein